MGCATPGVCPEAVEQVASGLERGAASVSTEVCMLD